MLASSGAESIRAAQEIHGFNLFKDWWGRLEGCPERVVEGGLPLAPSFDSRLWRSLAGFRRKIADGSGRQEGCQSWGRQEKRNCATLSRRQMPTKCRLSEIGNIGDLGARTNAD